LALTVDEFFEAPADRPWSSGGGRADVTDAAIFFTASGRAANDRDRHQHHRRHTIRQVTNSATDH
jgi:hypothetical protein